MKSALAWLREHRAARLGLSGLSGLLVLAAIGLIAFPLFSNIFAGVNEGHLAAELKSPSIRQEYLNGDVGVGESLTRIKIPAINVNVVVVQGTTETALRAGAGHYANTPLPCEVGNSAIAGHRTTYGKPFANLDKLKAGDKIELDTPIGTCVYELSAAPLTVLPTDVGVVANTPGKFEVTLTTCTPKYSATHRLVANATMISSTLAESSASRTATSTGGSPGSIPSAS
ncbi:MAG: class E sortase [Acidimicrobiales bacterium]